MPQHLGAYQIDRELGRGAMGIVYLATDPLLSRSVAIKTLRFDGVGDEPGASILRERLLREARSAGSLSHPGIVTIHHVGQEEDSAYIVMEYVDGPSLAQRISASPLTRVECIDIVQQTAAALDYAHSERVIHRDVKPANIMIGPGGRVRVADFGIAKVLDSATLTQTGHIVGTPSYMSPEQLHGRSLDGRSDQFSLAVIAYSLLTGSKPFSAESFASLALKIATQTPRPAHEVNPALTPEHSRVLNKALSKQPSDRYPACSTFAAELAAASKYQPSPDDAPTRVVTAIMTGASAPTITEDHSEPSPASRRRFLLPAMVLALLALAGITWWLWHPRNVPLTTQKPPDFSQRITEPNTVTQPPRLNANRPGSATNATPPGNNGHVSEPTNAPPLTTPLATPSGPVPAKSRTSASPAADAGPPFWPTSRGPNHDGIAPVNGPHTLPHIVWTADLGGQLRGSPVLASDGMVYIGSTDKNLYAIQGGKIVWTFPADSAITPSPSLGRQGEIRLRTSNGTVYNLDPSGQQLPTKEPPFSGSGAPPSDYEPPAAVTSSYLHTPDGDVIFGSADRYLYCVRGGQLRWKFPTNGPINSTPVVDRSGVIYFGSNDGNLYAVSGKGDEVWRLSLGNEIRSSPAFDREGRIYIATVAHKLYCLAP